jgi:PKHD-type hydroxylase
MAAVRTYPNTPLQLRTDVSTTLLISSPEDCDGGELLVEDTYGTRKAAGGRHDRVSGHQPTPHHADHAGSRIASFFWSRA